MSQGTTVDSSEVAKFEAIAAEWWDPNGKFSPLHRMNPCRLDYITRQIAAEFGCDLTSRAPFSGLRVLDIGCGGGLLSEPMARLGASVLGADAAEGNIRVARHHAEAQGLDIDYRATTAEALIGTEAPFDVVIAMEIIEHVANPAAFIQACQSLVRPGGLVFLSTLNRTAKSYALAIVGAEYVLKWLPKGTHDWKRFLTPEELAAHAETSGLDPIDRKGMIYNPLSDQWRLSDRDLSVNYVMTARRPA